MLQILSSVTSKQNMNKGTSVPRGTDKACQRAAPLPGAALSRDGPKYAEVRVTEDQVRGIFNRYDVNKDGILDKEELKDAFACLGSRFPGVRARLALHHADANRDGYISTKAELDKLVKDTMKRGYLFK